MLTAITFLTFGLTLITKLILTIPLCILFIVRCRPVRAVATKVPSIAPLFLPIVARHNSPPLHLVRRIIAFIGKMARYMLSGRIGYVPDVPTLLVAGNKESVMGFDCFPRLLSPIQIRYRTGSLCGSSCNPSGNWGRVSDGR